MKRWILVPVALAIALASGVASAAQGDWLGRARVININPDASSSALNLDASTETTLELDFTYFVTHNLGMELILATKKHDITAGGTPVGSVALLPPTLTLQYHFAPDSPSFRPYVGAGLNYRGKQSPEGARQLVAKAFTTIDAMAEYNLSDTTLVRLNINNLTDKLYADALYRGFYTPGAPRSVQVTLKTLF